MCSPWACNMDCVFFIFLFTLVFLNYSFCVSVESVTIGIRRPIPDLESSASPVLWLPTDTRRDDASPNRTVSNDDCFVSCSSTTTR